MHRPTVYITPQRDGTYTLTMWFHGYRILTVKRLPSVKKARQRASDYIRDEMPSDWYWGIAA